MDISRIRATELSNLIKSREITAVDAVRLLISEIKTKDDEINAYISLNEEDALNQAKEVQKGIEHGIYTSPIAGVPIAIKDNICTKGIRTTCASRMLSNFIPPYNATVIDRLEKAGAIILGKLNMDEFAMGSTGETSFFGTAKNPYDVTRVAGGSSSGAAAAVASSEAIVALGSDTGGSIRQPAAFTGLVGMKPTYGSVSRYGLIAYASSLDQIGPIGKSVGDVAAVLDVISGKDRRDSTSLDVTTAFHSSLNPDISKMRIGVLKESFNKNVDKDIQQSIASAVSVLSNLGAEIETIELPIIDHAVADYYIIATAEASSNLSRYDGVKYGYRSDHASNLNELYTKTRSEGFSDEVKKRIILGTFVLSSGYYDAYYRKALRVKNLIKSEFDKIFSRFDAVISPTSPITAPKLGASLSDSLSMYMADLFTVPANLAGLPAISVPCGRDKSGMPIGLQIIADRKNDQKVLDIGYALENALNDITVSEVKL